MAFRSQTEELAVMRARGQRPEGFVVLGDNQAAAWAARNRFFFVPLRDLGDDLDAFAGLDVVVRDQDPLRHGEHIQRLALTARRVTAFNTRTNHSEFISA